MQSVSERWYAFYNYLLTGIAVLMVIASVVSIVVPSFAQATQSLGLNYLTLGFATAQLIYVIFFLRTLENKIGVLGATFLHNLIFIFNFITIINTTGGLLSWYQAGWVVIVFFSGIFGPYIILSLSFLTAVYLMLSLTNTANNTDFDWLSLISIGASLCTAIISYYFWRKRYSSVQNAQIAKLSGQLQNKEQQADILIQSISDAIIVIDTEGDIINMNPSAARMTGWPVNEALGLDIMSVVKLTDEDGNELESRDIPFKEVLQSHKGVTKMLQLVSRDGKKQLIVSIVISPILLGKNQAFSGAVAVMRDVSVARKEEKQRAEFISTASHEMRTPVAAIEGYLALALNERVSKIDPNARKYLQKAHESTQHLGQLFQDLLTSAKAEDGRLVSHPEVVEMGEYLEGVADSFRFSAEKKGLLTEFVVGTSTTQTVTEGSRAGERMLKPLYYVLVDPDRLREVITNLFDNAVKYTPSGKISIGLTGNDDVVQIYIKDTGPGIPTEDIPHLFQKFYRVDNSATRTIGGTGLGLFICRKIIEMYKGRIWVESSLGKGSTFYINLPRVSTQQADEIKKGNTNGQPSQAGSEKVGTQPKISGTIATNNISNI